MPIAANTDDKTRDNFKITEFFMIKKRKMMKKTDKKEKFKIIIEMPLWLLDDLLQKEINKNMQLRKMRTITDRVYSKILVKRLINHVFD